jgi:outer membrane lipoprotein SlyB
MKRMPSLIGMPMLYHDLRARHRSIELPQSSAKTMPFPLSFPTSERKTMPRMFSMCVATVTAGLLASASLTGCQPDYSPNTYASAAAQLANKVDQGIVVGVRAIQISADTTLATGTGAAAGGIAGSQVGGAAGSAFGALTGSVAGGVAGNVIGHAEGDTNGFEYIVRKDNGDLLSVTQKDAAPLAIGAKVLIIEGPQARVVTDYTVQLPKPEAPKAAQADAGKPAGAPAAPPSEGPTPLTATVGPAMPPIALPATAPSTSPVPTAVLPGAQPAVTQPAQTTPAPATVVSAPPEPGAKQAEAKPVTAAPVGTTIVAAPSTPENAKAPTPIVPPAQAKPEESAPKSTGN